MAGLNWSIPNYLLVSKSSDYIQHNTRYPYRGITFIISYQASLGPIYKIIIFHITYNRV